MRSLKVSSLLTIFILFFGCSLTPDPQMYPGLKRDSSEVATLKCKPTEWGTYTITEFDGKGTRPYQRLFEILPGKHTIGYSSRARSRYLSGSGIREYLSAERGVSEGIGPIYICSIFFEAEAGHEYTIQHYFRPDYSNFDETGGIEDFLTVVIDRTTDKIVALVSSGEKDFERNVQRDHNWGLLSP